MDGNFSQQCRKRPTKFDESNLTSSIESLWLKKEALEEFSGEAPPPEAIAYEHDFRAAGTGVRRKKQKPVTGLFASLCARREIVHKVADMNSGEGLKYPLAILRSMFPGGAEEMPKHTVNVMYDVACMLSNSFKTHFQEKGLKGTLALPVFHAYAHVPSCQALRNPRNLVEFGRTDGEARERLWVDLNPFVKLTRSMHQSNRKLVLGQAIRLRNERKRVNLAETLLSRFEKANKRLEQLEGDFAGFNEAARTSVLKDYAKTLETISLGKSCSRFWSDLPTGYEEVRDVYAYKSQILKLYEMDKN
ncbi:unnamed protein product [Mucor hiemalis]